MITKKDKENLIKALDSVDVKKMELDHVDPQLTKWFRFGSYNGMMIAKEVIRRIPEGKKNNKKKLTKDVS